jgi:hypothetical protein
MRVISRRALGLCLLSQALAGQSRELGGRWAATDGKRTYGGTWRAFPQPEPGTCGGDWVLKDDSGNVVATGTWSVRKSPQEWQGAWLAQLPDGRTLSGSWTAQTKLPPSSEFLTLLESAMSERLTGTWNYGGTDGSWSVRTDVRR